MFFRLFAKRKTLGSCFRRNDAGGNRESSVFPFIFVAAPSYGASSLDGLSMPHKACPCPRAGMRRLQQRRGRSPCCRDNPLWLSCMGRAGTLRLRSGQARGPAPTTRQPILHPRSPPVIPDLIRDPASFSFRWAVQFPPPARLRAAPLPCRLPLKGGVIESRIQRLCFCRPMAVAPLPRRWCPIQKFVND